MPGVVRQLFRARLHTSSAPPAAAPPHPIGLFSVRVWTSPTSFIGCPHPPPARQGTGTLLAGIQQALAAALSERQVGGFCVFPLPLCCLLPYHMEVQAWFLEIPGLSHGPSVGRKEPSCHSLAGTTSHLGLCCCHGFLFSFHESERASRYTSMVLPFPAAPDTEPVPNLSWARSKGSGTDRSLADFLGEFKKVSVYFI